MPQRQIPNVGEDVSHLMGDGARRGAPGIGDDVSDLFEKDGRLPTRPVSAEDFTGPERSTGEKAWAAVKGLGRATIGQVPELLRAASDLYGGTLGGDLEAHRRTGERLKGLVGAQAGEFGKAREAFVSGRGSEGVGHTLAGLVPLVGPAAAHAGELAETDPYEAAGEAAGLLGTLGVPKVAPRVPGAARAAGAAIVDAGKASLPALKTAAKIAEYVPVIGEPFRQASMVKVLRDVLEAQKPSKGQPVPPLRVHGPDIEAQLQGSVWPEPAMHGPEVSSNLGAKLVKDVPSNEAALSAVLDELRAPEPASVGTLPPQPELPPGYTPRTTAPKPKPVEAAPKPRATRPDYAKRPSERAPKPRPATTHGPKNYFMRKDAPSAVAERVEPRAITVEDLPESWKSRTGQPLTKPSAVPKIDVNEVRDYLAESGLTAEEAIDALSRDRTLKTPDRIRLVEAINKTRLRRAQ